MTNEKRTVGRPRLYESSSAKVEAFRKRHESAGFFRKEVLVTKDTAEQLQALAKTHSVSVTDVASALLEHGLTAYQATSSLPFAGLSISGALGSNSADQLVASQSFAAPLTRSLRAASAGPAVLALNAMATPAGATESPSPIASSDLGATDPIQNFFARRKESTQ